MSSRHDIRFYLYRGSLREPQNDDGFYKVWRRSCRENFLQDCDKNLDRVLISFDQMLALLVDLHAQCTDAKMDTKDVRSTIVSLLVPIERGVEVAGHRQERLASAMRLVWGNEEDAPKAAARDAFDGWRSWDEETLLRNSLEWMPRLFAEHEHVKGNLCRIANKISDKAGYPWYRAEDARYDLAYILYSLPVAEEA